MHDYLGIEWREEPDAWYPITWTVTAFVGPDPRQRGAGQRWGACIVYPTGEPPQFVGPARDVMQRSGSDSAVLSTCSNRPAQYRVSAACLALLAACGGVPGIPTRTEPSGFDLHDDLGLAHQPV
jgi:hypothetical protein